MPAPKVALDHRDRRQRLAQNAAAYAAAAWRNVDRDDIARSWVGLIPGLAAVLTGAQRAAAGQAEPYLDAVVPGSSVDAMVSAAGFAGAGADGRSLLSLLFQPVIATLDAIKAGSDVDRAMAGGAANLDMIVRSEVADAGRIADQVAIVARPDIEGYTRVIVGTTCNRCIILAGRWYPYSEGFRRHPRCDCVMLPTSSAEAGAVVQDPMAIYESMTESQRTAAGWSQADQKAIDEGADINQVTNARRGTYTAGGRRYTTEGTSRRGQFGGFEVDPATGQMSKRPKNAPHRRRLTPDQIFADAASRGEAIRLLRENGYLTTPQRTGDPIPTAKVKPVPDAAKPFHRSIVGMQDLADRVENGRIKERVDLTGGVSADTELLTYDDGGQLVFKSGNADAEQAAAMIARAMGLPAPRVYRNANTALHMDYVADSKTADQIATLNLQGDQSWGAIGPLTRQAVSSPEGLLIGLLDTMITNGDRNVGNWMLSRDGRLTPIDHGHAFKGVRITPLGRALVDPMFGGRGLFSLQLNDGGKNFVDNAFTQADIAELTARVKSLEPDFAHIGHADWLRYALAVLEAVKPYAKGTVNLVAGVR